MRRVSSGRSDDGATISRRSARAAVAGEVVEELREVGAERRVGREHAEVLVERRGLRVVVAGADVAVAADAVGFLAHDEQDLAVRLQAHEPVDDVDARLLEAAGPFDVRLLVEAGLELDEGHHLLAFARRLRERRDDAGLVAAGAVQRLLDREHARVARRGGDERLDARGERLVREVHEHVAGADVGEDVVAFEAGRHDAAPRRVLQVVARQVVERPQPAEVERRVDHRHLVRLELELTAQQVEHLRRHRRVDLEPHRATELGALLEHDLDRAEQIFGFVGQLEVGVARDSEDVVAEHLHAGEQRVEMRGDHLLERNEALAVGEGDEPRQERRNLHRAKRSSPSAGSRTMIARLSERFEMYGNGCAGSTASGVSTGKMRSSNTAVRWLRSARVEVVPAREADAGLLERGRDLLGEHGGLAGHELVDARADRVQLLDLVEPVGRGDAQAGVDLILQRRDPHLEELVEVLGEDREELRPLEERQRRVFREREDAGVEVEPRELAVEVRGGRRGRRWPSPPGARRALARRRHDDPWVMVSRDDPGRSRCGAAARARQSTAASGMRFP